GQRLCRPGRDRNGECGARSAGASAPCGRIWRRVGGGTKSPSNQNEFRDGLSGEERLIARYFRPLATAPSAFGLGDDAATLTPPAGCDLVLTTDGVIAGVHFFPTDPPQSIARKALRMNLS